MNNFVDGITAVELLWLDGDRDEQTNKVSAVTSPYAFPLTNLAHDPV